MGIPEYVKVTYKNKEYCVCKINRNDEEVLFVVDLDDIDRILKYSWYKIIDRYITSTINNKTVFLHSFIMNKEKYEDNDESDSDELDEDNIGDKADEKNDKKKFRMTIDHINRIGMDNRKANLHNATASEQNINKRWKNISAELPKDCGISIGDVPKFVWYSKSRGNIGEYFEVRINTIPGMKDIRWCSTSASDLSLKFKLEHTKKYLRSLRDSKPDIFKSRLQYYSDECIASMKEYNEILKLSKYKCVKDNLVKIPDVKDLLIEDTTGLTEREIKILKQVPIDKTLAKMKPTNLPKNCEITAEMIPLYCYYQIDNERKGEAFYIGKKHPKMNGKRWYTTASRDVSIKEKFNQLLAKLKELEDNE